MNYEFYQIKSKKSEPHPGQGIQVSLACLGQPEIKIFLWFSADQSLRHIQFLFEECILEWKDQQGISLHETDRRNISLKDFGKRKGSRTTRAIYEQEVYQKAQQILQNALLPHPYKEHILQHLRP